MNMCNMPYMALGDLNEKEMFALFELELFKTVYLRHIAIKKDSSSDENIKQADAEALAFFSAECLKAGFDESSEMFIDTLDNKYPRFLKSVDIDKMPTATKEVFERLKKQYPERF